MPKAQYPELFASVEEAIHNGTLPPGTKLPTHRDFAEQNGVALSTATRTYKELEKAGLIVGEQGRGVFVRDGGVPINHGVEQKLADGSVDLVFNMPNTDGVSDLLRSGMKRLAASGDLESMLRYQPHAGRVHERKIIAGHLSKTLGPVDPDNLLVTSGAQHGIAITALGLLNRRDSVLTDNLTYTGIKSIADLFDLNLIPVGGSFQDTPYEAIDRKCREHKVMAIYLMPTVHNPLGVVIDEEQRKRIVQLAHKYDFLIIEDAAYAFLENNSPPSMYELAPNRTIHIGGFSKSIATGLRVGYLISPDNYLDKLLYAIRATTWNVPAIITSLITSWIEDGTVSMSEELRRIDGSERQKRCRKLLKNFDVIGHKNASFAWIPLPGGVRADPIVTALAHKGIAVSSADPFAVTKFVPQALRLAFGGLKTNELDTAIEKLRNEIVDAIK